jgi:RNA polymerase sigma-70 factor (ECF subfamily)
MGQDCIMRLASTTELLDAAPAWSSSSAPVRAETLPPARDGAERAERPTGFVPDLDDEDWLQRVRQGDEDAARALVQRLYPTVIKSVRYHLPKRTAEEDLVQAVFLKIFKNLGQYSGLVPLEHWVSRITVNTCINALKHERVRPELRLSDLTEEAEAVVTQLLSTQSAPFDDPRAAALELVEALLARLKPDERLVITLLHLEERTVKQISHLTGWSVSLVKVRAFRARHKMRGLWREFLQERHGSIG